MSCEGLSRIDGPIPPHPMFLNQQPLSERARTPANNTICEGPSKLCGPLATHYENDLEKMTKTKVDYAKKPRVRESGRDVFEVHKSGNGVAFLIELQGRAYAPTFKVREPPKNYMAANANRIKQLMRKMKEREQQKEGGGGGGEPVKAMWRSDKFKDVHSKVKEFLQKQEEQKQAAATESRPASAASTQRSSASSLVPAQPVFTNFLRAHSKSGAQPSRPQTARAATPSTASEKMTQAVQANVQAKYATKDDINFISHNCKLAKQTQVKRAPSVEMLKQAVAKLDEDMKTYNSTRKGKVPTYLEHRKEELKKQQSEFIKNMPDPEQPPGHRKLPEEERLKTLALLKETQSKLLAELNSLPIRLDTLRIQRKKSDMEQKLVEVEEAIKIFSKPKVFVKIDQ